MRTLIAGFGNVLRGDDGFGVEVVRRLAAAGPIADVEFMDVGTGGVRLAQELLGHYDRLIIVDAMRGGGPAGSVYVQYVESVANAESIDMHSAVPSRAMTLAKALGVLPLEVYLVGCEPAETEELQLELSDPVRSAVQTAMERIRELLSGAPADSASSIERQDEILELLYWLEGEGFADRTATVEGLVRFLAQPEPGVRAALGHLLRRGQVERNGETLRLTETGRRDAAARFAAEFAPMLSQGHGECNDPDCDCHTNPAGAAECHAHRAHGDLGDH